MFAFLRRLRARLKYRHFERDLAEEIETHRVLRQADLQSTGHSPDDARTLSYRELGNLRIAREDGRAVWMARWIDASWQDLRYALRGLRRRPGFALTAISILGLSTGLLTAVVIFADATLLRPWRVPDPDRLGYIRPTAMTPDDLGVLRIGEQRDISPRLTAWSGIALAIRGGQSVMTAAGGATEQIPTLFVTRNYFDTLGMPIRNGRTFSEREADPLSPRHVLIISHRLWLQDFHGDPAAIGSTVRLQKGVSRETAYTIVGVAPEDFIDGLGSTFEAWIPLELDLGDTPQERLDAMSPHHSVPPMSVIGRIAPGHSKVQALADLQQASASYRQENHVDLSIFSFVDTRPIASGGNRRFLGVLEMAGLALGLVQLLACANVGNLLLASALARQRELAVRLAIGAGRLRLLRQFLVEAIVLVAIATTIGFATALLLPRLIVPMLSNWPERPEFYGPGVWTFGSLLAIAAVSTLIVGVAPAFKSTTVEVAALANDRHGQTRHGMLLRRILLGAQIALATVLVSVAALLTRGVTRALSLDPGFPIREFQDLKVDMPSAGNNRERRASVFQGLFAEMQAPGWPPNAYADLLPIDDMQYVFPIKITDASGIHMQAVLRRNVSVNYFDVLGVPLLKGRMPAADSQGREVVVNESAAKTLFPARDAIDGTFVTIVSKDWIPVTVVGIVRDLPVTSLVDSAATAYAVTPPFIEHLLVRSTDPTIASRVSAIARRLDPDVTLTAHPLVDSVSGTLDNARMGGLAAWAISAIGLMLATIGAFGVFAYAVEERRREVGIRMALGARPSQVIRFVLRSSQWTMLTGLAAGLTITMAASPLLRAYLYGLSAFDPITYLEVAAVLGVAATLATWIPARRATRINPVDALRAE